MNSKTQQFLKNGILSPFSDAGIMGNGTRPWYLAGGIDPSNVVAAYKSIGASSYLNSLINIANPGTNNASGTPDPAFDSATGWSFSGSTAIFGPPDSENISVFCKFTNAIGNLFGCATTNGFYGVGVNNGGGLIYCHCDGVTIDGATVASGVIGMSGTKFYLNGDIIGTGLTSPHSANGNKILIGTLDIYTGISKIQAFVAYNRILTEAEVKAVSESMISATESVWFCAGGAPLPIAAYQAIGAKSLADSYVNLANPGVNDILPIVSPNWDVSNGWKMDGTTQYMDTSVIPHSGWSMLIRYSTVFNIDMIYAALIGQYTLNSRFDILLNPSFISYGSGSYLTVSPTLDHGVLGISGQRGYRNGIIDTNEIGAWSAENYSTLMIGNINNGDIKFPGYIQAVAIYDQSLSSDEMLQISNKMSSLSSSNDVPTEQTLVDNYVSQKFGTFFHFGMATFQPTDFADPELDPNIFSPSGLNINGWLDAVLSAGCKYACLTTKHVGGFALWPTSYNVFGYNPYSVAQSNWYKNNGHIDIVGEFVSKCKMRGINPVLYFGIKDTTYELRSGTTAANDPVSYTNMIKYQLTELLTKYGDITGIWFDSWQWTDVGDNVPLFEIFNHMKSIQPKCIMINNNASPNFKTQIETFESSAVPVGNIRQSETSMQIRADGSWFWHGSDMANLKDASVLNAEIAFANANNSSYLLALTPNQDGEIPANQIALMEQLHT